MYVEDRNDQATPQYAAHHAALKESGKTNKPPKTTQTKTLTLPSSYNNMLTIL